MVKRSKSEYFSAITHTVGLALVPCIAWVIIWLGYTFLSPITATAGGFYSVWHNVVNSWQLYKYRKSGK